MVAKFIWRISVLIAPLAVTFTVAAGPLHPATALEMAWRIERVGGADATEMVCLVVSIGNDVIAQLSRRAPAEDASWAVSIGYNSPPRSLRYLRVGREVFVTDQERFHGAKANEIVGLLKQPTTFSFEWAMAPDYAKRQGLFGTGNFASKAAECERWLEREAI